MDIKMFFEFPGVLITIGVFLLVVSIVIGVIAYKNPVDDEEEIEDIKSKLNEGTEVVIRIPTKTNNKFILKEEEKLNEGKNSRKPNNQETKNN